MPHIRTRIPILGSPVGNSDGRFVLTGQTVGQIMTPPSLEAVADAYAVYFHGTSMLERFREGEIGHVNPHRPVRPGDDVVLQIRDGDDISGYVKRFVSRSSEELVVEQLNPSRQIRFLINEVIAVHKVVGIEHT